MADARQKVALPLPNLIGFGKRPVCTPNHQVDLHTGMIGGIGGSALGSPIICLRRKKPVSGSWFIVDYPVWFWPLLADREFACEINQHEIFHTAYNKEFCEINLLIYFTRTTKQIKAESPTLKTLGHL